jgi:ABC-2 type transport system ATP-binding protein
MVHAPAGLLPSASTGGRAAEQRGRPGPPRETARVVDVDELRKVFRRRKPAAEGRRWARLVPGRRGAADDFVAVDGISFSIARGEIFGLLGPNGAGKSTTIRMLCTLLEPTSGTARVVGYDAVRQADAVRQHLGAVLTGERSIYWKLTGRENLAYFAALYHLPPAAARRRSDELLARLDLASRADDYVERYSSGMKQRLAIAKALLANPPVLLLDEPTIGLDPQSARNLRELIAEIRDEGRTVLLTTHYMEEADQLCDRIGIIDHGTIIALDTPANLKKTIAQQEIVVLEVERFDPARRAALAALPTVEHVAARYDEVGESWTLTVQTADSRAALPSLIEGAGAHGARIRNVQSARPSLEDVFIALTGRQLRD